MTFTTEQKRTLLINGFLPYRHSETIYVAHEPDELIELHSDGHVTYRVERWNELHEEYDVDNKSFKSFEEAEESLDL